MKFPSCEVSLNTKAEGQNAGAITPLWGVSGFAVTDSSNGIVAREVTEGRSAMQMVRIDTSVSAEASAARSRSTPA